MRVELFVSFALLAGCGAQGTRSTEHHVASSRAERPPRPPTPSPVPPQVPELVELDAMGVTVWWQRDEGPARVTLVSRRGDDGFWPRENLELALAACTKVLRESEEIEEVRTSLTSSGTMLDLHGASEVTFESLWRAFGRHFPACASPPNVVERHEAAMHRWSRRDLLDSLGDLAVAELDGQTVALDAYADAQLARLRSLDLSNGSEHLAERFATPDLLLLVRSPTNDVARVMGDVGAELSNQERPTPPPARARASVGRAALRFREVTVPGDLQLHLIARAPERTAPERLAYELAVEAFGGATSSRLFAELRETEGLTYGSQARLLDLPRPVLWAAVSFDPDEALENTRRFLRLFTEAHTVGAQDLDTAVRRRWAHRRQALAEGEVGPLVDAWMRGLETPRAVQEAWLAEANVTPEEVTRAASTWFDAQKALLVILGDEGTLANAAVTRAGTHFVLQERTRSGSVALRDVE